MSAETILVIIVTLSTFLLLAIIIWKNSNQTSFLYSNARISARSTFILTGDKMLQLSKLNTLPELINSLKDTEYYPFLESINKRNIREFNSALETGFIHSLSDIQKISPKGFQSVFTVYTKIFESKLIKTFFRANFSKIEIDKKLLEPIGTINPVLLQHLHDTKTIADMKLVLRDTTYAKLFEKEYSSIEEFDSDLEKMLMSEIDSVIKRLKVYDRKALLSIFSKRREIKNILMLIKFRIRGLNRKTQKEIIELARFDEDKLVDAPTLKDFVNEFKGTEYEKPLQNALIKYEETNNYYSFEKELLKYYYDFVTDDDLMHTIGPYPIISYITKKEIEQKNLLIIAKGIISDLSKQDIEDMII